MKRLLILVCAFCVLCALGQAAGAEETVESGYAVPKDVTVSVQPTVQIHEPGTIALKISWTTPSLTFVRRVRAVDGLAYYTPQSTVSVPFTLVNNSRPSSDGQFDGRIQVTAVTQPGDAAGLGAKRKSVSVRLSNDNIPLEMAKDQTDSGGYYTLSYADRGAENLESLSIYPAAAMLTDGMTAEQITQAMTVAVKFKISRAPVQAP